jgi:hypothetical protein
LVTADEAADALGSPVDEPERSSIGEGFSECIYRVKGGTQFDSAVAIQARGDTSRDDFERLVKENAPEELGEVKTISGLGDAAYYQVATFALKGDAMVVITVISDANDEAKQKDLAEKALEQLP